MKTNINTILPGIAPLKKATSKTPGTRHQIYTIKYFLAKPYRLLKNFNFNLKKSLGKCSFKGTIISRHRATGCKSLYKHLTMLNFPFLSIILYSFYNSNRTTFISVVFDFLTFKFYYIPAVKGITAGAIISSDYMSFSQKFLGSRYQLLAYRLGSLISFVNKQNNNSACYAKSAGTFCQIVYQFKNVSKLRLPSGQIISLASTNFATFGINSNSYHRFIKIGKAGRNRKFGIRPTVRGIAKNPVDHPHGGRTNGGCCWVTPWGKPFRFKKTSNSRISKLYKLL